VTPKKQAKPVVLRTASFARNTTETRIAVKLTIEGSGIQNRHRHSLLRSHAGAVHTPQRLRLELKCDGDLDVDQHHTVEDVGIALGEAFDRALGDKRGILRAGYFLMPMDETLAIAAVDLSGRAAFAVETKVRTRLVGDLQTELVTDFFEGFAREHAPTFTSRPCMAAPITTRSKPFSKPSPRARCAWPAPATNN